jgi:hypothetical protein
MHFRCIPIPTEAADRFRRTGIDDGGNPVIRRIATGRGEPCRHCLRGAEAGEEILLLSWHLPRPLGVYWTPSPIFLHAESCPAFDEADRIPDIVQSNALVSVRAYDRDGMCLYDLGQVAEGEAAATPLAHALDDPRTAFVNIHTARPGCLLCAAEVIRPEA